MKATATQSLDKECTVTSLGGKESEPVQEVERCQLEIVGLTSTHSLASGTQRLERVSILVYSGVARGEPGQAGVSLLTGPCVGVYPSEQEGRLPAATGQE